ALSPLPFLRDLRASVVALYLPVNGYDSVCLFRTLGDVTLCAGKRKPFDVLAEGLQIENSRGDWI
ncbi:MAG: hypothetical protein ACUVQK_08230, partial [Thermogutta sp.]